MTTHLLEEADKADSVLIMSEGKVIADGSPQQLRSELGDGIVTIATDNVDLVERLIVDELGLSPQRMHHQVRLQSDSPASLIPLLVEKLGEHAHSISIGRPSLEDVFIAKTGLEFAA
jgi:ABC-2 type transport system ATP-binding protein